MLLRCASLFLLVVAVFGLSPFTGSHVAFAASFDCNKAAAPMDFVVCSSQKLMKLNDAHADAWNLTYHALGLADRHALVTAQRDWMASLNGSCELPPAGRPAPKAINNAQACVSQKLKARIDELVQIYHVKKAGFKKTVCQKARETSKTSPAILNDDEDKIITTIEWNCSGYLVRKTKIGGDYFGENKVQVIKNNKVLSNFGDGEAVLSLGEHILEGDDNLPPLGVNVIGGTTPQIAALGYSGGAHCCFTYYLIDLGESPKMLAKVGSENPIELRLPEVGKTYELHTAEEFMVSSFAESPAINVVETWTSNGYRLETSKSRRRPPTEAELALEAKKFRTLGQENSTGFWARVIDLTYSGNMRSAEHLFDLAWSSSKPEEKAAKFDLAFNCDLQFMPSWPEVAAINGVPASKPNCQEPG